MKESAQHPTTQYATDAVYGSIVSCEYALKAYKRHLADLDRVGKDKDFPYVFDTTRADRAINFFSYCNHVRGPESGKPIELAPWQKFFIGCIFGWVWADSGKRRFKTAYIRIARGNAKSTLMSGLCLLGMTADAIYEPLKPENARYEHSPEVVCGAVDREQANIVWGDAREMALASEKIKSRLNIKKGAISHLSRGGAIKKLSKDTKNKDGGAPCFIVIDEYHAHPNSLVKDVTSSGKGKRAQCLEFIITTAGEDAENKPCKIEDDIVKKILDGVIVNEDYFGIIYELDKDDDVHDTSLWVKSNPIFQDNTEYSKELFSTVKSEHDLAFGSGDISKIRQWMIKRANRWQYDAANRCFSMCMDKWKESAITKEAFHSLVRSRQCYCGLDLSRKIDLTGTAYVFKLDDGRVAVTSHAYIPHDAAIRQEQTDRVPYRHWAQDGWCTIIDGAVIDDNEVMVDIIDTEQDYGWKVKQIRYDPYSSSQLSINMTTKGYTCVEVRQGVRSLSEPTKLLREMILQGKVVHDGNPILTWCLSNAIEQSDTNGNIKISKTSAGSTQRVDLAAALINAMTGIISEKSEEMIYSQRGMISLSEMWRE